MWMWLIGLLVVPGIVVSVFDGLILFNSGPFGLLTGLKLFTLVVACAAAFIGYKRFREHTPMRWGVAFVVGSSLAGVLAMFAMMIERGDLAFAFGGAFWLAVAYVAGLAGIRGILFFGNPIFGIARTTIDEAIRMKVGMIFIAGLVLTLPLLPFVMDPGERLEYRVQTFLAWSVGGTSLILSFMTIFLSCATITRDVVDKHVFMTMTKSVRRFEYLVGKWLGLILINFLLVLVSGIAIYMFTMLLSQLPGRDQADQNRVVNEVLVARVSIVPAPAAGVSFGDLLIERAESLKRDSNYDFPDDMAPTAILESLPEEELQDMQNRVIAKWYSIGPGGAQTYRFNGVDKAAEYTDSVQLRLKPKMGQSPPNEQVQLLFVINGRPLYVDNLGRPLVRPLTKGVFSVVQLPLDRADENGNMEVSIINATRGPQGEQWPHSVSFERDELEVLYRVASFEENLFRGMTLVWVRLSFLSVVGIAAGTFMGFPVACLLTLMVYFVAISNAFFTDSFQYFTTFQTTKLSTWEAILWYPNEFWDRLSHGKVWDAVKMIIRLIGEGFVALIPAFGDYNPVPYLADGRMITNQMMRDGLLWVGLIWSGVIALGGWLIWRKREMAKTIA